MLDTFTSRPFWPMSVLRYRKPKPALTAAGKTDKKRTKKNLTVSPTTTRKGGDSRFPLRIRVRGSTLYTFPPYVFVFKNSISFLNSSPQD